MIRSGGECPEYFNSRAVNRGDAPVLRLRAKDSFSTSRSKWNGSDMTYDIGSDVHDEPSLMMPGITISFLFREQGSLLFRTAPL